jgi:hypothetical protein
MSQLRSWCRVGVSLAVLMLGLTPHAWAQATVRVEGDHFTVNDNPQFLIFISYFDALRASDSDLDADFAQFHSWGLDGIRILPNWTEANCSTTPCTFTFRGDTLITTSESYSTTALNKLKNVLAKAAAHNLLVDVSFTRDTICANLSSTNCSAADAVSPSSYYNQVTAVLANLHSTSSSYTHVLVDFQNERDLNMSTANPVQRLAETSAQHDAAQDLANWAHTNWPTLPIMASTTETSAEGGTVNFVQNAGLTVTAYHDPRKLNDPGFPDWYTQVGSVVSNLRPAGRPVYLQEPMPYSTTNGDSTSTHFRDAIKSAVNSGAAAWTFHTRSAFNLNGTSYLTMASSAEEAVASSLRTYVNDQITATGWGTCRYTVSPSTLNIIDGTTPVQNTTVSITLASTPATCSWTTDANSNNWITMTPSSGSGSSTTVNTAQNTGTSTQTATIHIADHDVTVNQCPSGVVSPTSLSVWPSTKNYAVSVTVPSGCGWSASSNASWLTVSNPTNTNSGNLNFTSLVNHVLARSGTLTVAGRSVSIAQPRGWTPVDYDGDQHSDPAFYRPSSATFYWATSSSNYTGVPIVPFGNPNTDIPLTGDYDGDGKADPAFYRPSSATFYWATSSSNYTSVPIYPFGVPTPSGSPLVDIPLAGDYDGDGKTDIAFYRPSSATFYWATSSSNYTSVPIYPFGVPTPSGSPLVDIPLTGDYDGDGKADPAFYRPSSATFYWATSSSNYTGVPIVPFGVANADIPLTGDYDGDGKADPAFYRPSSATFYWATSSSNYTSVPIYPFGVANADIPLIGDYDGDGKADPAFYRPSSATFYWATSSSNYTSVPIYPFGVPTPPGSPLIDIPLARQYPTP